MLKITKKKIQNNKTLRYGFYYLNWSLLFVRVFLFRASNKFNALPLEEYYERRTGHKETLDLIKT